MAATSDLNILVMERSATLCSPACTTSAACCAAFEFVHGCSIAFSHQDWNQVCVCIEYIMSSVGLTYYQDDGTMRINPAIAQSPEKGGDKVCTVPSVFNVHVLFLQEPLIIKELKFVRKLLETVVIWVRNRLAAHIIHHCEQMVGRQLPDDRSSLDPRQEIAEGCAFFRLKQRASDANASKFVSEVARGMHSGTLALLKCNLQMT